MQFGATIARDVFQYKLDQCFGHALQMWLWLLMTSWWQKNNKTTMDHDQALTTLLDTLLGNAMPDLIYDKLHYKKEEVDFFGENYTTNGHNPGQSKVKAITEMPVPTFKKQVQSFIGMINYLSKFSARLSELVEPIRELCKDKVPFNLGPEHQEAFKLMKREIVAAPICGLLYPKKTDCLANWCKHQGSRSMCNTRPKASVICKQSIDWGAEKVCSNRVRILGCSLDNGKISSFSLCKPLCSRNRPKALRGIIV